MPAAPAWSRSARAGTSFPRCCSTTSVSISFPTRSDGSAEVYRWPENARRAQEGAATRRRDVGARRGVGASERHWRTVPRGLQRGPASPPPAERLQRRRRAVCGSAAYGDIVAATLAFLSLLTQSRRVGVLFAWVFNLWGTADLLNAFYQANSTGLLPGHLGATYFVPTLVVPVLLITHAVAFRILLQHQSEGAVRARRLAT